MELRDYQKKAVSDIYRNFKQGKKSVLLSLPTGAGKSVVIAKMTADAYSRGRRVLILVHRTKLARQLQKTVKNFCGVEPAMIIPGSKPDYTRSQIFIAMVQTISRRELPEDIGYVMIDEAHSSTYFDIWKKVQDKYSNGLLFSSPCFFLGLTATPYRTNKKQGFCQFFQAVVTGATDRELMNQSFLTNMRVFSYETSLDTKALEVDASGDYTAASLIKACNEQYFQDIANKIFDLHRDRKIIAFTSDVSGCEKLNQMLLEKGFKSDAIHSKTPDKTKDAIYERFDTNETRVLVSVSMLVEGFDQPDVDVVAIARPTRSLAMFKQMVGRGLRLHANKTEAYLLDFGNCVEYFTQSKSGYKIEDVFDVRHVGFCGRIKPPNPLLKPCPQCNEEIHNFASVCPHCGYVFPTKEREKPQVYDFPSLVEVLQGQSKEHYSWFRKTLATRFLKGQDISSVLGNFKKKFGYLPPKDWAIGALFGKKGLASPQKHAGILTYALMHNEPHLPRELIQFQVELEFGIPGKTYLVEGLKHEAKRLDCEPLTCWEVFGCDRYAKQELVYESYNKALDKGDTSPNALNYLLGKALSLGVVAA